MQTEAQTTHPFDAAAANLPAVAAIYPAIIDGRPVSIDQLFIIVGALADYAIDIISLAPPEFRQVLAADCARQVLERVEKLDAIPEPELAVAAA